MFILADCTYHLLWQCAPFSWFMDTVAAGVIAEYPPPPANSHWGLVRWHEMGWVALSRC